LTFEDFDLIDPLLDAIDEEGYDTPTAIQARTIPALLEGRDCLGCAQTGTGKTAAFALPILQHLDAASERRGRRPIRALILSPTRELAAQIGERLEAYGRFLHLRHVVIFGGVGQGPQVSALRRGVDALVATPGRLLDLIGQGHVDLSRVEFFVLDEADRMLDMGFIHDIRKVLRLLPAKRQNLLFSATFPPSIVSLASGFLSDPVRVDVAPKLVAVDRIAQKVMFVAKPNKRRLLAELLDDPAVYQAIVFTRTKHGANRLVKQLRQVDIGAEAIHGNKSQSARKRALDAFRDGDLHVLVATDLASRGLDVEAVTHVFNFDLPNEPESYVHRIGRTGRAGRDGIAISFCDASEGDHLRAIERSTGNAIPVDLDHRWHLPSAIPPAQGSSGRGGSRPRPGPQRGNRGGSRGGGGRPQPGRRRRRRGGRGGGTGGGGGGGGGGRSPRS